MAVACAGTSARLAGARRGRACVPARRALGVRAATPERGEAGTEAEAEEDTAKIDFTGLKQLVSMGLGTISGDIKEINLNDPTRTVVMELEANNFEDKEGKPLQYLDNDGYVSEDAGAGGLAGVLIPAALGVVAVGGVVVTLQSL